MNRFTLTAATLCASIPLFAQAGPKEEVEKAIKKLISAGNYSWTSTTKGPERPAQNIPNLGGGTTTVNGKLANGFVFASRTQRERTSESLRKGDKIAHKRGDTWTVQDRRGGQPARQGQPPGRSPLSSLIESFPAAERAADLLGKVSELKKDGELYAGDLTAEAAKMLLTPGGGRKGGPEVKGGKVSVKFWIKGGWLEKYETSITGSIPFGPNDFDLSRVTTNEIKDVGSTTIDVPEETRKKLESEKTTGPEKRPESK